MILDFEWGSLEMLRTLSKIEFYVVDEGFHFLFLKVLSVTATIR